MMSLYLVVLCSMLLFTCRLGRCQDEMDEPDATVTLAPPITKYCGKVVSNKAYVIYECDTGRNVSFVILPRVRNPRVRPRVG